MNVRMSSLLPLGLALLLACSAQADAAAIVVDAGHGGHDPGALGTNGLEEKTVNLDVALRLRDELKSRGYQVFMTRDTDEFWPLADRVAFTNEKKPDAFVSIHANWFSNPSTKGSMVLYYDKDYPQADYPASDAMIALTPESKRLANLTLEALVKEAGTANKGLEPSAVYVTRMGSVPSILVETGFLSNPQEAAKLADPDFRAALARGIANGITAYLPLQPASPAGHTPPASGASASPFMDVDASHWAYAAIVRLAAKGVVQGESGSYFPDRSLTRAEFVAMLERQFPLPTPDAAVKPAAPKDLLSSHWAYLDVLKAMESGILQGYPDGTVRPDQPLTRGEAAYLIDQVIYPGESPKTSVSPFKDVPASSWYAAAVHRLKSKELVQGRSGSSFAPDQPMTRAEMAALLSTLIHE